MVAKTITKLIDEAILPALLLIVAKVFGILLAAYFLKLNYTVAISIFPKVSFNSLAGYKLAENYSNLAMFMTVAVGMLIILVRAHYLHDTHIKPKMQQKLAKANLENIIITSYSLYHKATIWLTFLWLTVAFLLISTALKITYPPITIVAVIVALNFSWIMAKDVQNEIEIRR